MILSQLSSVPNDIKRYSGDVADAVDKHLQKVSNVLRDALSSSDWLPASARPKPPPAPSPKFAPSPASSSTLSEVYSWVSKNKILTGLIVVVAGGSIYYVVKKKSSRRKRRARRAANGARLDVVVIAGSPAEPITRSLSLDLERRGFIVYVVCNTIEEEVIVQNESRPDIKPFMIDIIDASLQLPLHFLVLMLTHSSLRARQLPLNALQTIFIILGLPSKGQNLTIFHFARLLSSHHKRTHQHHFPLSRHRPFPTFSILAFSHRF